MSEKDSKDILARRKQQQGTLGMNRARMCSRRDHQVQMELDQTHFAEANIWHNQAGPGVESARQKEGGKTSENLEEVSRRGAQTSQHHLECGKKNSHKQSPLTQYSVRPLFHEEPNGLTTTRTCAIKRAIAAANMLCCCCCAAILVHSSVRGWARICYVIGFENTGFTRPHVIGFFEDLFLPLWRADLKMFRFATFSFRIPVRLLPHASGEFHSKSEHY